MVVCEMAAILSQPQCINDNGAMMLLCSVITDPDNLWMSDDHDDVMKWKHFPRNWPFVRAIHRSPVNSPHKGQWRGSLVFSLICVWINDWVNNREAGDLRRYRAHSYVIVMRTPSHYLNNGKRFVVKVLDKKRYVCDVEITLILNVKTYLNDLILLLRWHHKSIKDNALNNFSITFDRGDCMRI